MKRRQFLSATAAGAASWLTSHSTQGQRDNDARQLEPERDNAGEWDRSDSLPEVTWSYKVPLRYKADVAVIGGGIAGVSAAAHSGASVVLVEQFAVTGGVLTSGDVSNFCDSSQVRRPLGEVFARIISDLDAWNAIGHGKSSVFHCETMAVILQELLLRRDVKLLLHTRFVDARLDQGWVRECIVCGASGPEALRAKQFIDCSGESVLARAAGFRILKDWYDGRWQLPMSMMYFVRHVDAPNAGPSLPEGWFQPIRDKKDLPMTSVWPDGPGGNAIKIKDSEVSFHRY